MGGEKKDDDKKGGVCVLFSFVKLPGSNPVSVYFF